MNEIATDTETDTDIRSIPPDGLVPAQAPAKKKKVDAKLDNKPATDDEEKTEEKTEKPERGVHRGETAPLRQLRIAEDAALKDILDALGAEGGYKISVKRHEPSEFRDPAAGRMVNVGGLLKTYENQRVDEDFVQQRHGGGVFDLKIMRRDPLTGSPRYLASRRIEIAGDPRLDDVHRNVAPAASAPAAAQVVSEQPSVVTKAMDMMERFTDKVREHGSPQPVDTGAITKPFEAIIRNQQEQMTADRQRFSEEMTAMRAELASARAYRPPEDPIKEKILGSLIDGESGRISGLRATHESELRTVKANAIEDEKRLRDSFERDKASLMASFDRERTTMIHSHDISVASAKASFETQIKVLEGQIRTLERDNTELRTEVKELRAKKDKSIVDMAKELEIVKDVLGSEESSSSFMEKVGDIVTNPDVLTFGQRMFGKAAAGAAQPPAQKKQQAQAPKAYKPQIVKGPDGKPYYLVGNEMHPVKKRGSGSPGGDDLPIIKEETVSLAVTFLERAFENGTAPEACAGSAKALVPAEIVGLLRDHGPDVFMTKVAKIPTNSSLSSQEAKNWMRKFAKALVG